MPGPGFDLPAAVDYVVPERAAAVEIREFDYDVLVRPMEGRMMRSIWRIVRQVGEKGPASESGHSAGNAFGTLTSGRIIGYVLFAAVLVLTVVFLVEGQPQAGPLPIGKLLLHGPAYLVVFGGAIALALFMGSGAGARAWTFGFAMTGLISLLMGLIQALFGFVHGSIAEISSAVAFIISASSLTLLGLVAVAAPLEDREVMDGRKEKSGSLSRLSWVLFPLLTFIFLVITFIMVVTPMKKPG